MYQQSTQTIDLSHEGVDRILAALADAGVEVHYNETDGDTFLDVWLTDLDAATATILSWRDSGEGWQLRQWESFSGDTNTQAPDRKWPITAGNPAEVARDVAACLAEPEPEPEPDYWLTLADDLRATADKIATLAGTGRKPSWVSFGIQVAAPGNTDVAVIGHVDTIAAVFEATAATRKTPGAFYEHAANTKQGFLRVDVYGYVPEPEDPEKAAMRARIAELEAERAQGGAR